MPESTSELSRMKPGAPQHSQRGFALVIALGLMAFILLLMLSLSTFIQVELRSAATQKEMLLARQNALLALHIGLGELQRHAGPDQRVTASASLLERVADPATFERLPHSRWIGAWNSDADLLDRRNTLSPDSPEIWLVSAPVDAEGNRLGPLEDYTGPEIILLEPRAPAAADPDALGTLQVRVPLLPIETNPGEPTGGFAWWADDEGLKARVNLPKSSESAAAPRSASLRYQAPDGPDFSFPFPQVNWASEAARLYRERSISFSQFEGLLAPSLNIDAASPHLTLWSRGVHSDVAKGGLKQDLSTAFEMPLDDFHEAHPLSRGWVYDETMTPDLLDYPVNMVFHELVNPDNPNAGVAAAPTWQLLRNHYRLYKATDPDHPVFGTPGGLRNADTDPVLPARVASPGHRAPAGRLHSHLTFNLRWDGWDPGRHRNLAPPDRTYIASPTIAPVLSRLQRILSVHAVEVPPDEEEVGPRHVLHVHLDTAYRFWNPYNIPLEVDQLSGHFNFIGWGGHILLENPDPTIGNRGWSGSLSSLERTTTDLKRQAFLFASPRLRSGPSEAPIRFEPGEVITYANFVGHILNWAVHEPGLNLETGNGMFFGYFPNPADQNEHEKPMPFYIRPGDTITVGFNYPLSAETLFFPSLRVNGTNVDTNWISVKLRPTFMEGLTLSDEEWDRYLANRSFSRTWTYEEFIDELVVPKGDPNVPFKQVMAQFDMNLVTEEEPFPVMVGGQTNLRALRADLPPGGDDYPGLPNISTYRLSLREQFTWDDLDLVPIDGRRGFYGPSANPHGRTQIPYYEIPTAPLLSIAALQHLDVGFLANHASHAIGNSLPSPLIRRDAAFEYSRFRGGGNSHFDLSYLLNEALFDRYFFSGLAPKTDAPSPLTLPEVLDQALDGKGLLNPRHKMIKGPFSDDAIRAQLINDAGLPTPEAFLRIAALLMNEGAFNINSTSPEAWAAVLSSTLGTPLTTATLEGGTLTWEEDGRVAFPGITVPAGQSDSAWEGFRTFERQHILDLANAIVSEVKRRGPFKSVADFVNRRLDLEEDGLGGVLHAAIDHAGLNEIDPALQSRRVTEEHTDDVHSRFPHESHRHQPIAFSAPHHLTQADVLTAIGPALSARSDTFRIRFYGETRSLAGNTPTRAWGEAVVQRIPDYVDANANVAYTPTDPDQAAYYDLPELNAINQQFGRRFVIVDIRWLASEEI